MPDYIHVHDWLMKTWLGQLMTNLFAGAILIALGWIFTKTLRWYLKTFPRRFRNLSRISTVNRILKLKRLHGSAYALVLEIGLSIQSAILFTSSACAGTSIPVLIRLHRLHSVLPRDYAHETVVVSMGLLAIVFDVLLVAGFFGFRFLLLYRDLSFHEDTIQRLRNHLELLDQRSRLD